MHPPEYNLELVSAMLEEMETYLLSSQIFWPLSLRPRSGLPFSPRLTVGGLLLAIDELAAQERGMSPAASADYERLMHRMEMVRSSWPVGLERKAAQEIRSRLNLWRAYLVDIEERTDTPDNYAFEVRNRVMFQRLADLAAPQDQIKPYLNEMNDLDLRLQAIFIPSQFIWDERLQPCYPSPLFWYLYGTPKPM